MKTLRLVGLPAFFYWYPLWLPVATMVMTQQRLKKQQR